MHMYKIIINVIIMSIQYTDTNYANYTNLKKWAPA